MRYQNWDILMFPVHSRVPLQEFDTKCHVLQNPRAVMPSMSDSYVNRFESPSKVPILTCFIPSLAARTPFRISIHSWLKPSASAILRSRLDINEEPAFQARVYLDGVHLSSRTMRAETVWPEVIETTGDAGRPSQRDEPNKSDDPGQKATYDLLFPPFHPEILQQAHWDAGEQLGRIKVVISEGVMGVSSPLSPDTLAFDRLRDVIAFSFQHAPQNVLEYSGIAWPNVRMFESIQRDRRRPGPISTRLPGSNGHDAHAHSPRRSTSTGLGSNVHGLHNGGLAGHQAYPSSNQTLAMKPSSSRPNGLVSARALTRDEDPFMGPSSAGTQWRTRTRFNGTDESMPDYLSTGTGHRRTSTDMSVQWPRRDFQRHMDEAAVDEIVEALSPEKRDELLDALSPVKSSSSGVAPPTNTPRTAEASKQPLPVLQGADEVLSNGDLDLSRLLNRSRSTSNDSAVSAASDGERRSSASTGKRERRSLQRAIVTRSQKSPGAMEVRDLSTRPTEQGSRAMSDSSKRRKISLSPTTNTKGTPKLTLRMSTHNASSDKENQQHGDEDSGEEGVALTIE